VADAAQMRFRRSTSVVLGITVILVKAACSDGEIDPIVRENGAIVFLGGSFDDAGVELFSVNEDGSDLRHLTDDGTGKTALAWSPDGSQLAYAALRNGLSVHESGAELSSIYMMRSDGTGERLLCEACSRTAYAHAYEPSDVPCNDSALTVPGSLAWSTNDSMIAAPAAGRGVLLIDTGTGGSSTIPTPEPVTALAWSPDGRRLALSHTWFMTPGNASE
jgi:Tol biopolymer transport system component